MHVWSSMVAALYQFLQTLSGKNRIGNRYYKLFKSIKDHYIFSAVVLHIYNRYRRVFIKSVSERRSMPEPTCFVSVRLSCLILRSEAFAFLRFHFLCTLNAWNADYCNQWSRSVGVCLFVYFLRGWLFLLICQMAPLWCSHYYITVSTC